ncbi:MAG: class I SAM-dependent methyltransferase [Phycisphaerae bacterium]|nr:class I SAM-dependent methyltransferase [Phycisphaerae bacterium]MDW8263386.1 class I SAM-dependent methyltransferase [Phycisphaerales bacterium]
MAKARSKPALKTHWGGVTRWYDDLVGQHGSEYQRQVVLPGTLKLLEVKPGERILDVACGQGVLCRLLHERGAIATGVDAAVGLIERARQLNAALPTGATPRPDYLLADARNLKLQADAFDSAACVLAIQNIHPIAPVFEGVARALKPGGRFVIVMMHPCFRVAGASAWGWDDATRTQYRRVDKYLLPRKTPIFTHPGKKDGTYTWTFHRPIEDYFKALVKVGLLIDRLEEWPSHKRSESGPRAPAENAARREIPMFLAIRAVKPMPRQ